MTKKRNRNDFGVLGKQAVCPKRAAILPRELLGCVVAIAHGFSESPALVVYVLENF